MSVWSFMEFVEQSGQLPFSRWIDGIPKDARANIDARLLQMEGMPKWTEKWASSYRGYDKLIELRIPFNRVQYRPLGSYAPDHTFILLHGAIEKNGRIPKGDLESADRRRKELVREPYRARPYQY
jgi:phage-related protein